MDILEAIRSGNASDAARLSAARGLLPMEPDVLLEILFLLHDDEHTEIRQAVIDTVSAIPDQVLMSTLWDENRSPAMLAYFARSCHGRKDALEAVILNPSTSDETIMDLARTVVPELQELVIINQVRILRCPEILDALLGNPELPLHIRRRAEELKFDFFKPRAGTDEEKLPTAGKDPGPETKHLSDGFPSADTEKRTVSRGAEPEEIPESPSEPGAADGAVGPQDTDGEKAPKKLTLQQQLLDLDIVGKIRLAKMGGRQERMQLVKNPNRLVCMAAVTSPKLTESEVDAIAQMRGINDEVLRYIGDKHDWSRRYSVISSLVKNPTTPAMIARRFISRLSNLDLKLVSTNRNVPDIVRNLCKKQLSRRLAPGGRKSGS